MSDYHWTDKNITFTWFISLYSPFKSIKVDKEGGKIQKFEIAKIFFINFETQPIVMRKFNSIKWQPYPLSHFFFEATKWKTKICKI